MKFGGPGLLLRISITAGAALVVAAPAQAAGKRRTPPRAEVLFDGKRTVVIAPVPEVNIELPDGSTYRLGEDFRARWITLLTQSQRYTVIDEEKLLGPDPTSSPSMKALFETPPDYQWPAGASPTARVSVAIEAMTFQTGSRGSRMIYGFNDRLPNVPNEFYLRENGYASSWFGNTFEGKGRKPWDSRSGLELGEGFSLDALFAYLTVRYERYRALLGLRLNVTSALTGHTHTQFVTVRDKGYFLDVAGAYNGYSLGVRIARKDALLKATARALDHSYRVLDEALRELPIVGQVDDKIRDAKGEWLLLGLGPEPNIRAGSRFVPADQGLSFVAEVVSSSRSGAIARVVEGDFAQVLPGTRIKSQMANNVPSSSTPAKVIAAQLDAGPVGGVSESRNTLDTQGGALTPPAFPPGAIPKQSRWRAMWRAIVELVFLPYRIWRYYQYDQAFEPLAPPRTAAQQKFQGLAEARVEGEPQLRGDFSESTTVGSTDAHPSAASDQDDENLVRVAVVDTGVDFTHRRLRFALWQNPWVDEDRSGQTDPWGFDFISGDPRPYDDHFHGTQIASALLAGVGLDRARERVRIVPLKVFNPWGVTHSQALLGAFSFIQKHRIPIVVCGWDTLAKTSTLHQAVQTMASLGSVLFTGAGDRGINIDQLPTYPASEARHQTRVVSVAVVDDQDRLWKTPAAGSSNFGPLSVRLAVRGVNLAVAEPRQGKARTTSTGVAAAKAAGAFVNFLVDSGWRDASRRGLAENSDPRPLIPEALVEGFIEAQESVAPLEAFVREGRRLR